MLVVYCRDPLEPSRPARAFEAEPAAVAKLGPPHVLIDYDALVRGEAPARVVRRVPKQPETALAVYRGWMVTPEQYRIVSSRCPGEVAASPGRCSTDDGGGT